MTARQHIPSLEAGRRIIVKIGSALLVDAERGTLHRQWLEALAADLARYRKRGQDVIIVSSGAIAIGRRHLRFSGTDLKLEEKQAAAATGMVRLAHAYEEVLSHHGMTVAQLLLTLDDSEDRRRYLNARNTLSTLLRLGAVPLINENDTVATDEIRFGENDRLAGRVAAMISADILVLLSDIDGFYSTDPRRKAGARHIPIIDQITPEIEVMAGSSRTDYGTGGMITKIAAAKSAIAAGCATIVADGKPLHPLRAIEEGARCTWFLPRANPRAARKHWIAGILRPAGIITIDNGAMKALGSGKSLLPAGVTEVEGAFKRGDAVIVKAADGSQIGCGLSAYSVEDARRIMGHKSGEIESLLGYRGRDEMIHRDDLVLS
ncbi:MAG TPA: glutamate 5-kinase [Rhodospirillales bacterium]|jgi:glutamate 5-kinase|nr:glutamate 5-kinase [Rhodospirillales bacterium]